MQIKNLLSTIFCLGITCTAYTQSLPNKQNDNGLRAPVNVKVDGKANEWNNQFQAYNHATEIFYTLANDNNNLYLAIQAKDPNIIRRILEGGITFTVQNSSSKNNKKNVQITYPISATAPNFSLRRGKNQIEDTSAHAIDSIVKRNNSFIDKNHKWIRVAGISGVDTLISVYNTDGIQAKGLFNSDKVYTCELAINLKLLDLPATSATKFIYNVRLNGAKSVSFGEPRLTPAGQAHPELMQALTAKASDMSAQLSAPTDFSGEYTLVK